MECRSTLRIRHVLNHSKMSVTIALPDPQDSHVVSNAESTAFSIRFRFVLQHPWQIELAPLALLTICPTMILSIPIATPGAPHRTLLQSPLTATPYHKPDNLTSPSALDNHLWPCPIQYVSIVRRRQATGLCSNSPPPLPPPSPFPPLFYALSLLMTDNSLPYILHPY